jgi:predicted negative regulator of RcsB-dependent stress response
VAQHISRKELKKDEVRETFAHGAEAILSHREISTYIIGAAILIALGIFGWRTYSQHQTVKSFAAFDDAMKVFQAPVGPPPAPGELAYSDETKKYTDANQKFADIASKYPRTRAGELANYYCALSLEKLDKNDDAKRRLQSLSGSRDADVAAMAQFELASLEENLGQGDDAVKLYQELIAKPTALVPKPIVMLALANHYSQKDPSQAAKLYTQIKSDYPDTPVAQQADQALSLLPGKS